MSWDSFPHWITASAVVVATNDPDCRDILLGWLIDNYPNEVRSEVERISVAAPSAEELERWWREQEETSAHQQDAASPNDADQGRQRERRSRSGECAVSRDAKQAREVISQEKLWALGEMARILGEHAGRMLELVRQGAEVEPGRATLHVCPNRVLRLLAATGSALQHAEKKLSELAMQGSAASGERARRRRKPADGNRGSI
jgi:hypothetical protein